MHVGAAVLHGRAEPLARGQEFVHAEAVPGVAVHREHPVGPAPFALEGEEAVPRADVQHRPAGEVVGNAEQPQAAREAAPGPPLVRKRRLAGVGPADDLVRPFGHPGWLGRPWRIARRGALVRVAAARVCAVDRKDPCAGQVGRQPWGYAGPRGASSCRRSRRWWMRSSTGGCVDR